MYTWGKTLVLYSLIKSGFMVINMGRIKRQMIPHYAMWYNLKKREDLCTVMINKQAIKRVLIMNTKCHGSAHVIIGKLCCEAVILKPMMILYFRNETFYSWLSHIASVVEHTLYKKSITFTSWCRLQLEAFPRYWPFVRESTGHWWNPLTKANDAGIWCFLWSAPG